MKPVNGLKTVIKIYVVAPQPALDEDIKNLLKLEKK